MSEFAVFKVGPLEGVQGPERGDERVVRYVLGRIGRSVGIPGTPYRDSGDTIPDSGDSIPTSTARFRGQHTDVDGLAASATGRLSAAYGEIGHVVLTQ